MKRFEFIVLLVAFSCAQSSKQDAESKTETIDLKTQVGNMLIELDKPFDNTAYQKDIESLRLEVAMFFTWSNIINQALNSEGEGTIRVGRSLYEKVVAIQETEFPLIRKRYSVLLAPKLIRYNAQAKVSDRITTTLFVYSKDFSSREVTPRQIRNRNSFQNLIKETVKLFRFKSVTYSEKENAPNSSSYRIKSLDDDEIVNYGSSPEATFKEEPETPL